MNAAEQAKLGALLDMGLAHAGLGITREVMQGTRVVGHQELAGEQIVIDLLRLLRWRVGLREPAAAALPGAERPGRASPAAMLRLVRHEVEPPPTHEPGHGEQDAGDGHRDVTGGEG